MQLSISAAGEFPLGTCIFLIHLGTTSYAHLVTHFCFALHISAPLWYCSAHGLPLANMSISILLPPRYHILLEQIITLKMIGVTRRA